MEIYYDLNPTAIPTPINDIPEIIFVIFKYFLDIKKTFNLESNEIINIFPSIGTEKETEEINNISTILIWLKSKTLGKNER